MTCPICKRETVAAYRPFCSRRCADVDLGRWLTGAYVVPAEAVEEDEAVPEQEPGQGPGRGDDDERLH